MIRIENVSVQFNKKVHILHDASYEFKSGNVYALVGSTEQAQTAFLSIVTGLSNPNSGSVYYQDQEITKENSELYRTQKAKLIRAEGELIPYLNVKQNLEFVKDIANYSFREFESEISELTFKKKTKDLTRYEMIQVCVERSMECGFNIIILQGQFSELSGDEKTRMMDTLKKFARKYDVLFIVATSEKALAKKADKVVMISDTKLI